MLLEEKMKLKELQRLQDNSKYNLLKGVFLTPFLFIFFVCLFYMLVYFIC